MGAFGEATVEVGGVEVNAEVNLVTVNIPDKGPNTVTQGFGIGLKGVRIGKIPLFLGIDRTSYDGGLSWEPWQLFGASDPIEVSREGVSAKLSVGLIVGGEVAVNNLQNVVPCAQ